MFQSRSLRSSPGTYLRCSLNSTEKPWNGLACSPARKPSTMKRARRSSRATWRMTSGRRYFSGLAAIAVLAFRQDGAVAVGPAGVVHLDDTARRQGQGEGQRPGGVHRTEQGKQLLALD